jgi:hypothetical protein
MTRDIDITDTEFPGAMKVRFADVDVTNYDSDSGGDGEPLAPSDVGMHRFQVVNVQVKPGEGSANTIKNCVAQYDYQENAIRLYEQANDGTGSTDDELVEVPSDVSEGAMVRVEAKGR